MIHDIFTSDNCIIYGDYEVRYIPFEVIIFYFHFKELYYQLPTIHDQKYTLIVTNSENC